MAQPKIPGFNWKEYITTERIFQELYEMRPIDDNYPIFGSWVINGKSAGLGIRETTRRITDESSRFIPHAIQID